MAAEVEAHRDAEKRSRQAPLEQAYGLGAAAEVQDVDDLIDGPVVQAPAAAIAIVDDGVGPVWVLVSQRGAVDPSESAALVLVDTGPWWTDPWAAFSSAAVDEVEPGCSDSTALGEAGGACWTVLGAASVVLGALDPAAGAVGD